MYIHYTLYTHLHYLYTHTIHYIYIYSGEQDDVKVWRCKRPIHDKRFKNADKYPCIKATTIINTSTKTLMDLLMDSSKITLVNKFSSGRTDMLHIDEVSKVSAV